MARPKETRNRSFCQCKRFDHKSKYEFQRMVYLEIPSNFITLCRCSLRIDFRDWVKMTTWTRSCCILSSGMLISRPFWTNKWSLLSFLKSITRMIWETLTQRLLSRIWLSLFYLQRQNRSSRQRQMLSMTLDPLCSPMIPLWRASSQRMDTHLAIQVRTNQQLLLQMDKNLKMQKRRNNEILTV